MTPETYLQRVRALLPALRERAVPAERLRRLPDETFADFQEAGLFRCLQPKRYGGYELDPATLYQAVIEVGAVCGSTGWILGVIGIHNWHLALFAPQAQDDVWGKDTSIQVSTSLAPTGTVTRVDGGFRLQGRSEYRTHSYRDAFYLTNPGAVVNDGPLYRLPFGLVFPACISSPAIGVALGALAAFRDQTTTRISPRDKSRVAEDPFVQFSLAEAAAEVTAARDRLLGNFAEAMRLVREGAELSLTQRARYRWDTAKAADRCVRAVDRLFEASGGRGIFLDNPIQRAWRDVHAIRAHAGNNLEKAAFVFGRSEFGLPPLDLRF